MDSEPLTKLQRKCLVSLWNVLPYSRDNEPHAAEDINRINSTCDHWESRAAAAEAEVKRLKADVQGFLHTLASFALEDEDPDVRVALGKERAKVQSLTADLRVAVEALRKELDLLDVAMQWASGDKIISEFLKETGLSREFFDTHIAEDGQQPTE